MFNPKSDTKVSGFTLIELLVVIAIIALLLSVVVPSLSIAKESARMVVCKSNLKQIVTGANLWSYDNEDWTVAVTWFVYHEFSGSSGVTGDWPGSIEPYTNSAMTYDHIHHDKDAGWKPALYACPSLKKKKAEQMKDVALANTTYGWFLDTPTQQYKGYAANGYSIMAYSDEDAPGESVRIRSKCPTQWAFNGPDVSVWKDHGSIKLSNIQTPASYMYFMDHVGYTINQEGPTNAWASNLFYGPSFEEAEANTQLTNVWRWHKKDKQANLAYFDGHVGTAPRELKERSTQILGGGFLR